MGKRFCYGNFKALEAPERAYRLMRTRELGEVELIEVEDKIWIANIIGQHGIKPIKNVPPIRYDAIEVGFKKIISKFHGSNYEIHMPRIGCGLAGGDWDKISKIIENTFIANGIDVYTYTYTLDI